MPTENVHQHSKRHVQEGNDFTVPTPGPFYYSGWKPLSINSLPSHYESKRSANQPGIGYEIPQSYNLPTYSKLNYVSFDNAPEPIYGMVIRTRKSNDCKFTEKECTQLELENKFVQCELSRFR